MRSSKPEAPDNVQTCSYCGNDFPLDRTTCPHCAQPQLFPNVTLSRTTTEKAKLSRRYAQALKDAEQRDCLQKVEDFADACRSSAAVFRCTTARLHRQVASGTEIFAPYYDLERLRLRTGAKKELDYEKLRPQAEIELLGNEKHISHIHYACLSLDGQGLTSYGDCVVQLSEPLIAHRATCFEGNTAVLYAKKHGFADLLRSDWENRHAVCTAAMAHKISSTTSTGKFAGALTETGDTSEHDRFIEVHVFGEMTAQTFKSVHFVNASPTGREKVYQKAICEKLKSANVTVNAG